MNINTISQTYTFFGNFSKLNNKEDALKAKFEGYTCQVGKEKLPNGIEVNVYRFSNVNKAVTIHTYRIDFEYGYNSPECNTQEFISHAEKCAKLIAEVDTLKGQRIAYSNVEFIENLEGKVISKANQLFNIAGVFGSDSDELNVRVNHKKEINGEIYNSVLIMQDGNVTNKQTNVQTQAMFINKDINTLIQNREERFNLNDTVKYLSDMIIEANEHTNALINKIED